MTSPTRSTRSKHLRIWAVCAAVLTLPVLVLQVHSLPIFRPIPLKVTTLLPKLTGGTELRLKGVGSVGELAALGTEQRSQLLSQVNAAKLFGNTPVPDFSQLLTLQSRSRTSLAEVMQRRPSAVLARMSPLLGAAAAEVSVPAQRRALVAMTHEDKVSVRVTRKAPGVTDEDVVRIADDLCAIIAEGALPLDNEPLPPDALAEKFVKSAELLQRFGFGVHFLLSDRLLPRAASAANDPLMEVKVSGVKPTRDQGVVDFRISHEQFRAEVRFEAYNFGIQVGPHPNVPNVERISLSPSLW